MLPYLSTSNPAQYMTIYKGLFTFDMKMLTPTPCFRYQHTINYVVGHEIYALCVVIQAAEREVWGTPAKDLAWWVPTPYLESRELEPMGCQYSGDDEMHEFDECIAC